MMHLENVSLGTIWRRNSGYPPMKFTEAQLESAIIELLGAEGYPHVLGEAIERTQSEHTQNSKA